MRELIPWIEPLGLIWLSLFLGSLASAAKRQRTLASALFLTWALLTAITCTPLPSLLLYSLEKQTPPATSADIAGCGVLVCLGGGIEPAPHEPTGLHLKRGSDRVATALTLGQKHGIPHLVLGGGSYGGDPDWRSEADDIAALLDATNFPNLKVHSLGACANTRDEALKVLDLLPSQSWEKIGLITSANHMPRAAATFRKAGIEVLPIPCNYLSSHMRLGKLRWFHSPGPGGLLTFHDWLHEVIGSWYYRHKGWM